MRTTKKTDYDQLSWPEGDLEEIANALATK